MQDKKLELSKVEKIEKLPEVIRQCIGLQKYIEDKIKELDPSSATKPIVRGLGSGGSSVSLKQPAGCNPSSKTGRRR